MTTDIFFQDDGSLWLPKYELQGPNRKRPTTRRWMGRRKCCCGSGPGPGEDCSFCEGGKGPQQFQVVITGVGQVCPDPGNGHPKCDGYNATWICNFLSAGSGGCTWRSSSLTGRVCDYSGGNAVLNNPYVEVRVHLISAGEYGLDVLLLGVSTISSLGGGVFRKSYGSDPVPCRGLTDENIPPLENQRCDVDEATCLVTAL